MHVIHCDYCDKEATRAEDVPLTWFEIDHGIERFGVHHGPWHLCSWKCVSLFGALKAAEKGEMDG